jgi:formate-dependent nitrite reductase membrane component NrfD
MWSRGNYVATDGKLALPVVGAEAAPRRAYDVRPRAPAWGWEVSAYTWTKSIATGSFLAVLAARLLDGPAAAQSLAAPLGVITLIFLALTAGLLVADLKQPRRFLYVLLRPQWKSWLVRGAYGLTAFGGIATLWLVAHWAGAFQLSEWLLWPGASLAVFSAVYTAFLFAQAKGRDFWQNPLLSVHLLAHALLAGGALWLLTDIFAGTESTITSRVFLAVTLVFSLLSLMGELFTMPPTTDARMAMDWIVKRPMGQWFWGVGIGVGHLLPLALLALGTGVWAALASFAALAGLYVIEWLWVQAPQTVPLS